MGMLDTVTTQQGRILTFRGTDHHDIDKLQEVAESWGLVACRRQMEEEVEDCEGARLWTVETRRWRHSFQMTSHLVSPHAGREYKILEVSPLSLLFLNFVPSRICLWRALDLGGRVDADQPVSPTSMTIRVSRVFCDFSPLRTATCQVVSVLNFVLSTSSIANSSCVCLLLESVDFLLWLSVEHRHRLDLALIDVLGTLSNNND
jgi:hypothetical protein